MTTESGRAGPDGRVCSADSAGCFYKGHTAGSDCPSDSGRQGPSGLGLAPLEDQFKDNETRETKPNPVHFRQGLPK